MHPIPDGCDPRKSISARIIGKSRLILHVSHQVGLSVKLPYCDSRANGSTYQVPRTPKPVSSLTEAASSGRIQPEPGRVLLSTCLHMTRDAYNFLTSRYSDAAISVSSRDQLGNGDHNSGLSAKGLQARGSIRKVLVQLRCGPVLDIC